VVASQLTVYDDAATAKQVVPQMNNRRFGCSRYAGRDVDASLVSLFGPDRFFGITVNHDGTVFSEGSNATRAGARGGSRSSPCGRRTPRM